MKWSTSDIISMFAVIGTFATAIIAMLTHTTKQRRLDREHEAKQDERLAKLESTIGQLDDHIRQQNRLFRILIKRLTKPKEE